MNSGNLNDQLRLDALDKPPNEKYRFIARVPVGAADAPRSAQDDGGDATLRPTVYIVRDAAGHLLVERRLPRRADDPHRLLFLDELLIHSNMRHANVLEYVDGFMRAGEHFSPEDTRPERLPHIPREQQLRWRAEASLYTEHCPLGTLHQLRVRLARACAEAAGVAWRPSGAEAAFDMDTGDGAGAPLEPQPDAATRQALARVPPLLPEAFLWHVLIGLMSAVAYMRNGAAPPQGGGAGAVPDLFVSALHRDVRPHNVWLRARAARTAGASGGGGGSGAGAGAAAAATASPYPDVLLGNFNTAIARDSGHLGAQNLEPHGALAWQGPGRPQHAPGSATDFYGVGCIVACLYRNGLDNRLPAAASSSYSQLLYDAIRLTQHDPFANAGEFGALLSALPPPQVIPLPPWALDVAADPPAGYDQSRAAHAAFYNRYDGISVEELPYEGPEPEPPKPTTVTQNSNADGALLLERGRKNVVLIFEDCWARNLTVRQNRLRVPHGLLSNTSAIPRPVTIIGLQAPGETTTTS